MVACAPIDEATSFGPAFSSEAGGRTRAFLKIQDGCDYNCAFCTIPLARGASRSQTIDETILQAQSLAASGFREIVLTGVNVGDFGSDDGDLAALLRQLEHVGGIERIRISSIEPNLFTPAVRDAVTSSKKVCPHFHIPLQSGSDTMLRVMRRRYDTALYRELVTDLVKRIPDAAIGVDVITGFPGETEIHARETLEFLTSLPVAYLHVFTYSERENTAAIALPNPVDKAERKHRTSVLRELSYKKRHAFTERFIGSTRSVLFEQVRDGGMVEGWTDNYIPVRIAGNASLANTIANVRLESADGEGCIGSIASHGELIAE